MPDKKYRIETQCIQAGYKAESGQPQVPPIVQNTTYRYYNAADVAKLFDLESADFMYTRLGSPTVNMLEEKMAALEGGTAAIAASSGQAANMITMLNICEAGDHIIAAANIYGGMSGQSLEEGGSMENLSALDLVMELAVEFPLYQRRALYVYQNGLFDDATLELFSESTAFQSPLSKIWLLSFAQ